MKRTLQQKGRNALDLVEEATHLLRTAPVATLAVYYLGAAPFVLGVLYFWADMSRSPFAGQHLADAALGTAVLFLWMKFWQVLFARRLRAQVAAEPMPRWSLRRCGRILLTQAMVQPGGLFVIPLSLLPALALPWAYAFYQSATALDDGGTETPFGLVKKSWKQTILWPRQNHIVLILLGGFGLIIFLNWAIAGLMLPRLIKTLFGVESVFTRDAFAMLNTTFFAGMAGLTYLCVDPILKAVYVLRCFYGEARESGADLRAELNASTTVPASLAALVVGLVLLAASPVRGADTPAAPTPPARTPPVSAVSPTDLDQAINQTIHEKKFTWRMPREERVEDDAGEGVVARFFDRVGTTIRKWARTAYDWIDKWLRRLFRRPSAGFESGSSGRGWISSLQFLLFGLVALVLSILAVFIYRLWRNRQTVVVVASEPIRPAPDLQDDNVGADQLPEDGWIKMAREFLDRGEFRLAMRAFYLASLAHLATRNLISIARFKSNHEYERELHRRGHSFPDLLSVFGDNLAAFERIWYGLHEANRDLVDRFAANVEKMKTGA